MSDIQITMVRSNRRTMAIQVNPDLTVTVRAPMHASRKEIERILQEKENWIQKSIQKLRERKISYEAERIELLSDADMKRLAKQALDYIPGRVAYYAKQVGVDYGRITIRSQKTRWGSCSGKGNLNFNCLLMLTPPEVIDYVVVHELCHRKEMNHSRAFWEEVAKILPGYREQVQWLKTKGGNIMRRRSSG